MIIPSHIPNVPKWVVYEAGNKVAWLDPATNSYHYHNNGNITYWVREKDITYHMQKFTDIQELTSLGYIISRMNNGLCWIPRETIKMYVKDVLEAIHKENNSDWTFNKHF